MVDEIDTGKGIYEVKGLLMPLIFDHGGQLPDLPRTKLFEALNQGSPVDALVGAMEALYSGIKQAPGAIHNDVHTVCGQCAFVVCVNAWHGKADRAASIFQISRRALGLTENATTPDPETDPEVLPEYLVPAED